MAAPSISVIRHWVCPNCKATDTTTGAPVEPGAVVSRFHTCPALAMMTAPMVPAGTRAKITAHEREDYVGKDLVRVDANGRPIMSITVERENGQDAVVFAPTSVAKV